MPAGNSITSRAAGRPRGMAVPWLVVLVGLAMAIAAFGVAHAVCGRQHGRHGTRAAASMPDGAWAGTEQVRRHLERMDADALVHLAGKMKIAGLDGLAIEVVSVAEGEGAARRGMYRVTANIADAGAAKAGGPVLRVVYDVAPSSRSGGEAPASGGMPARIRAIYIDKDLDLAGAIEIPGGDRAGLVVRGNVWLDGASVEGIEAIRATGDVAVGSGVHVGRIHANGSVTITGAACVGAVDALGDVVVNGGARPFAIRSNGTVTFNGGSASSVEALGDVIVTAGGVAIASIRTPGRVRWTGSGGGAGSIEANGAVRYAGSDQGTSIRAMGDVTLTGSGATTVVTAGSVALEGFGSIGQVTAQGDLRIDGWGGVDGTIGGTLGKAVDTMPANVALRPGLKVRIAPVALAPLPPVAIDATLPDDRKLPVTSRSGAQPCTKDCPAGGEADDERNKITASRYP